MLFTDILDYLSQLHGEGMLGSHREGDISAVFKLSFHCLEQTIHFFMGEPMGYYNFLFIHTLKCTSRLPSGQASSGEFLLFPFFCR